MRHEKGSERNVILWCGASFVAIYDRPPAKATSTSAAGWGGSQTRKNERRAPIERGAAPPFWWSAWFIFWVTFFLMPQTRTSLDTPDFFFGDFLLLSRAEHNQNPPTDPANRHCALISTRRKIAVSPAPPPELRALAGGRSAVRCFFAPCSDREAQTTKQRPRRDTASCATPARPI